MKYPKHTDDRGYFQELHKAGDLSDHWKQIAICSIAPGATRGAHYHKVTYEKYIVIEGDMTVKTYHMKQDNSEVVFQLSNENPRLDNEIMLLPWVHHTVTSEKGCKFIILASKMFDPKDPDTYRE